MGIKFLKLLLSPRFSPVLISTYHFAVYCFRSLIIFELTFVKGIRTMRSLFLFRPVDTLFFVSLFVVSIGHCSLGLGLDRLLIFLPEPNN